MQNACKALGSVLEKRITNSSCFVSTVTRGFEKENRPRLVIRELVCVCG